MFSGLRRMERTVFLDGARCDGGAHGGCQVGCLFFWNGTNSTNNGNDFGAYGPPDHSIRELTPGVSPTRRL